MKKLSKTKKLLIVGVVASICLVSFYGISGLKKGTITVSDALNDMAKDIQNTIKRDNLSISKMVIEEDLQKTLMILQKLAGSLDPDATISLLDFYKLQKAYQEKIKLTAPSKTTDKQEVTTKKQKGMRRHHKRHRQAGTTKRWLR